MIPPYSGPLVFELVPLAIPLFGLLVATGVVVGHELVLRLAKERGIRVEEMRNAAAWAVGAGFVGAHVIDVLVYRPEKLTQDGIVALLKVWDGISSFGGFFGALAGLAGYFAWKGRSWWTEADLLVQGLVVGWLFGRLGCTLTSDHLGHLTSFPLAFAYPQGARHNLGFYELLWTAGVLVPAVYWIRARERGAMWLRARERGAGYRPGIYVAVIAALYAPARFAMDFLRATDIAHADPRWFGLTGGQYASMALLAFALWRIRATAAVEPRPTRP